MGVLMAKHEQTRLAFHSTDMFVDNPSLKELEPAEYWTAHQPPPPDQVMAKWTTLQESDPFHPQRIAEWDWLQLGPDGSGLDVTQRYPLPAEVFDFMLHDNHRTDKPWKDTFGYEVLNGTPYIGDLYQINEDEFTNAEFVRTQDNQGWEIAVHWGNKTPAITRLGQQLDIWTLDTIYRFEHECMRIQMILRRTQVYTILVSGQKASSEGFRNQLANCFK